MSRPNDNTILAGACAAALLLTLSGCAGPQPAPGESVSVAAHPADLERCNAAGHEPGSEAFLSCLQMLDLMRRQEALREQQINNATIDAQRRVPLPR